MDATETSRARSPSEALSVKFPAVKPSDAGMTSETSDLATLEGFCFDPGQRMVHRGGLSVALTKKEFDLARLFFRHAGIPFSREQILELIWCGPSVAEKTLDAHINKLRKKLKLSRVGLQLCSIYGVGYVLDRT